MTILSWDNLTDFDSLQNTGINRMPTQTIKLRSRTMGAANIKWGSDQFNDNTMSVDGADVGRLENDNGRVVFYMSVPLDAFQLNSVMLLTQVIQEHVEKGTL